MNFTLKFYCSCKVWVALFVLSLICVNSKKGSEIRNSPVLTIFCHLFDVPGPLVS